MAAHSKKVILNLLKCICAPLLFCVIVFSSQQALAVTRTWDGGGSTANWSEAANWSADTTPESGADVVFDGTSTKSSSIDAGFAGRIASLKINSGYTGTIISSRDMSVTNNFVQNDGTFTLATSIMTIEASNGTNECLTQSAGTFNSSSSLLMIKSGFNRSGGTFNHNSGTVKFLGSTSYILAPGGVSFYKLAFGGPSGYTITLNSNLTVEANMSVNNESSGPFTLTGSGNPVITVNGTLEFPAPVGSGWLYFGGSSGSPKLTVLLGRDLIMSNSNAYNNANMLFSSTTNDQNITISGGNMPGNFTVDKTGKTATLLTDVSLGSGIGGGGNFTLANGTFEISSRTLTIAGNYSQTGGTLNGAAGTVMMAGASGGSGTFTLSGGIFNAPSGTLEVGGAFTKNGGTFNHDNGTVKLLANSNYTLTPGGASFYNLAFGRTDTGGVGYTITLNSNLTVEANMSVNNESIYQCTVDGSGSPVITVNGTLEFAAPTRSGAIKFGGSFSPDMTVSLGRDLIMSNSNAYNYASMLFGSTTNDQNITVNSGYMSGNFTVNKTGKTATLLTNVSLGTGMGGGGNFTLTDGTFEISSRTLAMAGNYNQTGGTLNGASGTITLSNGMGGAGTYTLSGGIFNAPSGTLEVDGAFTKNGGAFNHDNGTVKFMANSNYTLSPGGISFYNLAFGRTNISGTPFTITLNSNLTVEANMRVNNDSSYQYTVDGSGSPVATVNGTLEFPAPVGSGGINFGGSISPSISVSLGRDLIMSNANAYNYANMLFNSTTNDQNITVNSGNTSGSFTVNKTGKTATLLTDVSLGTGMGGAGNFTLANGTFEVGTRTLTIGGSYSQTGGTLNGAAGMISVVSVSGMGGTFTLSGGIFNSPSGTLEVGGAFTKNGGTFNHDNGTVKFLGNSNYAINPGGVSFYNLAFGRTNVVGSVFTVTLNSNLTAEANMSVNNNSNYQYTVDGSGSPVITVNGNLEFPAPAANGDIYFGGSFSPDLTVSLGGDLIMSDSYVNNYANLLFRSTTNDQNIIVNAGEIYHSTWTVQKLTMQAVMQSHLSMNNSGLNIVSGTLFTNGLDLSLSGTFSNTGKLKVIGNENLTFTKDTDSGTVEYTGIGTTAYSPLNYGNSYKNLLINSATGSNTFSTNGTLNVGGGLTIESGALDIGSNNLLLSGSSFANNALLKLAGDDSQSLTNFVNNTDSGTVEYTGMGSYSGLKAGYNYYNLKMSGSGSYTAASTLDVNNTFFQESGVFTAPAGSFTVGGSFNRSGGTFTHNSGTVIFDDVSKISTVSGPTTFNNFICATAGKILTFEAAHVTTAEGVLRLTGSAGNLIKLRSTGDGTQWKIDPAGTKNITYVDVKDSNNINAALINPLSSIDSGNNTNWFPSSSGISGTVYTDNGITPIGMNRTILLLDGGAVIASALTDADGKYNLTSVDAATGDAIAVFISSDTVKGNTVTTLGSGTSLTGLDIWGSSVIARHEDSGPATAAILSAAKGATTDADVIYSVSGNNLSLASGKQFVVGGNKTFTAAGNISSEGLIVNTGGTFNAAASSEITVAGTFENSGTFNASTSVLTLTGTQSAQNIKTNGSSFYGLTIDAGLGSYRAFDDMTITGNYTLNSGSYFHNRKNVTFAGSGTSVISGPVSLYNLICTTAGKSLEFSVNSGNGYKVSGAGDASYNGNYVPSGTYNGRTAYSNGIRWLYNSYCAGPNANDWVLGPSVQTVFAPFVIPAAYYAGPVNVNVDTNILDYWVSADVGYESPYYPPAPTVAWLPSITTVEGTLTLTGSAGNLISLRSTEEGTQWEIDLSGARNVSYVDVKDSNNIATSPVNPANSTNSGNNTNWFTLTIMATAGAHGTIVPSGSVNADISGSKTFTVTAESGYYINYIKIDGSPTTETLTSPYTYTFTNITASHTIEAAFSLNGTKTWDGDGSTNNWSEASNWSGNTVPVSTDAITFNSTSTKDANVDINFIPNTIWAFAAQTGYSGLISVYKGLTVSRYITQESGTVNFSSYMLTCESFSLTGGRFTAPSSTLEVSGNFATTAGSFDANNGNIRLTGSLSRTITADAGSLYNIAINGSGKWTFYNTLTIANNLNILSGTLEASATAVTLNVGGNIAITPATGHFTPATTTLILTSSDTTKQLDPGGSAFYNITFGTGNQGTWVLNSTLEAANNLLLTGGTFYAQDNDVLVGGNWTRGNGTFSYGTSTVYFTKNSGTQYVNNRNSSFLSIVHSGSGTLALSVSPLTVYYDITNNAGTIDASSLGIYVTRRWTNLPGADFIAGSGTVYFATDSNVGTCHISTGGVGSGKTFNNIVTQGTSTVSVESYGLQISGNLTLSSMASMRLNGNDLILASASIFSNNSILEMNGNETLMNFVNDTDSGEIKYSGTGIYTRLAAGGNYFDLTFSGGTYSTADALTVNHDFELDSGTFNAPTGTMTVKENFYKNGGTFTHRSGTVEFTDASQYSAITGAVTFYNFKCIIPGKRLLFPAGITTEVQGAFNVSGDATSLIKLNSQSEGDYWYLKLPSVSNVYYANVKDSNSNMMVTAYHSLSDLQHNVNWMFPNPPAKYWVGGGATTNWSDPDNWSLSSGGASGAGAPDPTYMAVFDSNSGSHNCSVDSDITVEVLYVQGYQGTINTGSNNVHIGSDTNMTRGTINAQNSSIFDVGGTLAISGEAVFTAPSGTLEIGSSYLRYGGTFNNSSGRTIFNGGSNNLKILSNGTVFGTVTFEGVGYVAKGTKWTLQDDMTTGSIQMMSGDLIDNGKTVTAYGDMIVNKQPILLTSTGAWKMAANGSIMDGGYYPSYWTNNKFNALEILPGVTATRISPVMAAKVILDSNALLKGSGELDLFPAAADFIDQADGSNISSGRVFLYLFSGPGGSSIDQKAIHIDCAFQAGYTTNRTIRMTGDWTVGSLSIFSGNGYISETDALKLDTNGYNLTSNSCVTVGTGSLVYPWYAGKILFRSGTHNIYTYLAPGSSLPGISRGYLDMGSSTVNIGTALNLTNIQVTPGTSTVRFYRNAASTIMSSTESLNNIEIDKQSSTCTLYDTLRANNLTITSGTLSLNGKSLSMTGIFSNNGLLKMIGSETLTGFANDTDSGTTEITGAGSYSFLAAGNNYYDLKLSGGGTFSLNNNLNVYDHLLLTAGKLDLSAYNYTVTIGGNLAKTGGFLLAQQGTVVFNDASKISTVTGANSLYNLSCTTPGKSLSLEASATQTISGTLTLAGTLENNVVLRSKTNGTQWKINPLGPRSVNYSSVKDSWNINPTPVEPVNSTNLGNTTNWFVFRITSSTGSNGSITPLGTMVVNQAANQAYKIRANDGYYISYVKIDGASTTEALPSPYTYTFLNVSTNHTIEASFYALDSRAWSGRGVTNNWSEAANWGGNTVPTMAEDAVFNSTGVKDSIIDASFAGTVEALSVGSGYTGTITAQRSLTTRSHATVEGGTLTFNSNHFKVNGSFYLNSGVFNAPSTTMEAGCSFRISGGTFNNNSGEILLSGDDPGNTLKTNSTILNKLTLVGTGSWEMSDALSLNSLNISSGVLSLSGNNLSLSGAFINEGTLRLRGAEVLTGFTNDTDSGTVEYTGSSSYTGLLAGNSYNNLKISGSGTYTLNDNIYVNSDLSINSGTLDVSGSNYRISIGGGLANNGGGFVSRSATVEFNDASRVSTVTGPNTFYNLVLQTASKTLYFDVNTTQEVTGTFKLDGSPGGKITLRPTLEGQSWYIKLPSTENVTNTDVSWSNSNKGIFASGSIDSGNNHNWTFADVPNRYWVASVEASPSNWNNLSNWALTSGGGGGAGVPTAGAQAIFDGGSVQNCRVDLELTLHKLSVNPGYTGTITTDGHSIVLSSDLVMAGGTFDASSSVSVSVGGSLSLAGGIVKSPSQLSIAGNFINNGGTFNNLTRTVLFNGTSPVFRIIPGGTSFNNLTINGVGGAWSLTGTLDVGSDLTVTKGSLLCQANDVNVGGSLRNYGNLSTLGKVTLNGTSVGRGVRSGGTRFYDLTLNSLGDGYTLEDTLTAYNNLNIEAGALDVSPSDFGIIVSGNFYKGSSASFIKRNGTVTFNDASKVTTITGSPTFHNLICTESNKHISFEAASLTTVETGGNAILHGPVLTEPLVLRSTLAGSQWKIDPAGNRSISSVDVKDSQNINSIPVLPATSTNSGNNTGWFGYNIAATADANGSILPSGSVFVDEGSNKTFTVEAITGYYIEHIRVDGVALTGVLASPYEYTFTNVSSEHSIEAAFVANGARCWIGQGVTNNWSEAANWTGNTVPSLTDAVLFNSTSVKDSTIDPGFSPSTITSLYVANGYSGAITSVKALTVTNFVTLESPDCTVNYSSYNLTVPNSFVMTGGEFDAPSGTKILTLSGDFAHTGGSFVPGTGTVLINNAARTTNVSGSTAFYDLTCTAEGKSITFEAGSSQSITEGGTLLLAGGALNKIILSSSRPNYEWDLNLVKDENVSYVNVRDSHASGANVNASYSTDRGNNLNWNFINPLVLYWVAAGESNWNNAANWSTTSGGTGGSRVPSSDYQVIFDGEKNAKCNLDTAVTVEILSLIGYTGTFDTGIYSLKTVLGASMDAGAIDASDCPSFDVGEDFEMYEGSFIAPSANMYVAGSFIQEGGTFTNSAGALIFDGDYDDSQIKTSDAHFNNISFSNSEGSWEINGVFEVNNDLTLESGSLDTNILMNNKMLIGGNLVINGGAFYSRASTIEFDASSAKQIKTNNQSLFDVFMNGSGSWTLSDSLTASRSFLLNLGTLNLGGKTLNVGGNFLNLGTFVHGNGSVVIYGTGSSSITGSNVFYNLFCTAEGKQINFEAGKIQTVEAGLTLQGLPSDRITLRSLSSPVRWIIDPHGTVTASNLDVKDSNNIAAMPIDPSGSSVNSGNNINWFVPTPEAPSNFTVIASAIDRLTYTWTNIATSETGLHLMDGSNNVVCSMAVGTASTSEGGLAVNTRYTRRIQAYNLIGASTSEAFGYTSIEASTGATLDASSASSVTVRSQNQPSNLTAEASGILFEITAEAASSGWIQNNTYTFGSLAPNRSYAFRITTRNGSALIRATVEAGSKYTLAATPEIMSATGSFDATNRYNCRININPENNPDLTQYALTTNEGATWISSAGTTTTEVAWGTSTTRIFKNLAPGTTYTFKAKALNGEGYSTGLSAAGISTLTPPASPEGLSSSPATYEALMSWGAVGTATSYYVSIGTDNAGTNLGTVSTTEVSFHKTSLMPYATYYWHVSAANAGGSGETSSNVSFVTLNAAPVVPTFESLTPVSSSVLMLVWTYPYTNENGFRALDENNVLKVSVGAGIRSTSEGSLLTNTRYTRKIQAFNALGISTSEELSAYTSIEASGGATFESVFANRLTIHSSNALSHLSLGSSGILFETTSPESKTSGWIKTNTYYFNALIPNSNYLFRITTRNGDAVISATTEGISRYTFAATPDAPSVSASYDETNGYKCSITVNAAGNPAGTVYAVTPDNGTNWLQNNGTAAPAVYWGDLTGWMYKGLSSLTSYPFRVKARNYDASSTALSTAESATTPPSAPVTVFVSDIKSDSATATWAAVTGADTYAFSIGTDILASNIGITSGIAGISFVRGSLSATTQYYYKMASEGTGSGRGAWGAIDSFTTAVGTVEAPTNCSITGLSSSSVEVTWKDNSNNETAFHVEKSTDGSAYAEIGTTAPNITTYTGDGTTGLGVNTRSWFRVRSENTGIYSVYSIAEPKFTLANPPGAGVFGSIRSSAITASWTENGNPAGVTYYCEAPAGAGGSGWTGTLSFTSRSLTPDTVYSFRAKARNSDLIETGWVDLGSQTTKGVSAFASIIADGIDLLNGDIIRNKPALEIRTVSVSDITVSTFKIWIDDIQINDGSAVPGGYDSISASGKDIKFYYSPKTAITAGVHKIKAEVYDDEGTIFREQRTDLKIKTDKGITGAVLFYPNPIDPLKSTGRIAYTLNIDTDMTLFIFDTSGKIVWKYDCPAGLMGGKAGYNEVEWSGNDFSDRKLLNDVYLLRVVEKDTGSVLGKAKIVILRSSAFKLDINSLAGIIGLALFGLVGAGSVMGFRKFISPRKK